MEEECEACNGLKAICANVGEEKFCTNLLDKLKRNEISSKEFIEALTKNKKLAKQFSEK